MELLVKLYSPQPSRIGVKYVYEFQAVKAYQELLETCERSALTALAEIRSGKLDLTLTSEYNSRKVTYKALEFRKSDVDKLRSSRGASFIFVHVYPRHNTLMVAKPYKQQIFLQINALELRGAEFIEHEP